MDTRAARSAPGVLKVLTHQNAPKLRRKPESGAADAKAFATKSAIR